MSQYSDLLAERARNFEDGLSAEEFFFLKFGLSFELPEDTFFNYETASDRMLTEFSDMLTKAYLPEYQSVVTEFMARRNDGLDEAERRLRDVTRRLLDASTNSPNPTFMDIASKMRFGDVVLGVSPYLLVTDFFARSRSQDIDEVESWLRREDLDLWGQFKLLRIDLARKARR